MTTTKRPGRWAWVKWVFILPIVILLAVQAYFFVQIWWWVDHDPTMTAFMRQQQSAMREKDPNAVIRQQWVPYERI